MLKNSKMSKSQFWGLFLFLTTLIGAKSLYSVLRNVAIEADYQLDAELIFWIGMGFWVGAVVLSTMMFLALRWILKPPQEKVEKWLTPHTSE